VSGEYPGSPDGFGKYGSAGNSALPRETIARGFAI
jgi:hypothetical protein